MHHKLKAALGAVAMATAFSAAADPIVLTFEGVPDLQPVGSFYSSLGVEFSPATLAVVDADAGGSGNFANEPTPNTIMFFLDANNAILNYAAGFETGFSFFYTSSVAATVTVWDGLNGTGNLLGSINLAAQFTDGCTGDPSGGFCNFTAAGVAFAGVAKSINFGGTANQTGYDNITFGSATPGGGDVPEPSALALAGLALVGAAAARRRRA